MKLAAIVTLALAIAGSAAAGPPRGLTQEGRTVWNFEALLHDTFGSRSVCTYDSLNFVAPANNCTPGATWLSYSYVFADARHSVFHLVQSRPNIQSDGVRVIRVRSKYVACDRASSRFLILYVEGSAGWAFDCVKPV